MAQVVSGTFTATGQSAAVAVLGKASILIEGGVGTVHIEKSYNDGLSYFVVSKNSDGNAASYTTASNVAFNGHIDEPLAKIKYRLNCTAYTSGSINYRIAVD